MPEITVQFKNALNGYSKQDVDLFLKEEIEPRLQQRSQQIADLQKRVVELESKLKKLTGGDETVEQKVERYEKLMKKMDGDYENLLAPAIAKAKAIEEKAEKEYRIRIDQARYTADGIYAEIADRLEALLRERIEWLARQIEDYIRSQRLTVRLANALAICGRATRKLAEKLTSKGPKKAKKKPKNTKKQQKTGKKCPVKPCCFARKTKKTAR